MIEIFHVSDLHFGDPLKTELAKSLLNAVKPLVQTNNNYLLVTGDVTDHGQISEYDLAGGSLNPFAGRIFITPGNHDYGGGTHYIPERARYFDPFAKTLKFEHEFFYKRVYRCKFETSGGALVILGLNSCIQEGHKHWGRGEIGESQRAELKEILDKKYDASIPKILFLHHIPNRDAIPAPAMTLIDWELLMDVVGGRVDVLAFGHQGHRLKVDSEKSRVQRAAKRPMAVRSIYWGAEGAKKRIWVLDANASVEEQACYHIRWNEEGILEEPRIIPFGHDVPVPVPVPSAKKDKSRKKPRRKQ